MVAALRPRRYAALTMAGRGRKRRKPSIRTRQMNECERPHTGVVTSPSSWRAQPEQIHRPPVQAVLDGETGLDVGWPLVTLTLRGEVGAPWIPIGKPSASATRLLAFVSSGCSAPAASASPIAA